jgi:hypothetical protein
MLMRGGDLLLLAAVNAIVIAVLFVLEREWGFHYESSQLVRYDRIELTTPQRREELLADLRQRTGLPVKRIEVGRLNFLNDTAELLLIYDAPTGERHASRLSQGLFADPLEQAMQDDD